VNVFTLFGTISINKTKAIADLKAVETAGRTHGGKLQSILTKIGTVAKVAFTLAAAAAAGMFVAAIKKAADYQLAMAKVRAITGASAEEFAALSAKAKELGLETAQTMTDIAAGMEAFGRAGFSATEIVSAMGGAVALAESQTMDLATAVEYTANILRGMRLEAGESERVVNALAAAASSSNTTVESLAQSMKYFAPIAADLNIPLETALGLIGKLGDAGITGTMATRAMTTAFTRLAKPTDEMVEVMKDLNLEFFDAQGNFIGATEMIGLLEDRFAGLTQEQRAAAISTLFGAESMKQFSILIAEGEDGLNDYISSITGTTTAFDQQAEMLDTLSGQWQILKGSFELLLVTIGTDMMPILKDFLKDRIIPLVNGITQWIEKMGGLRGVFGHVIKTLGEYLIAVADWIDAHEFLRAAIDAIAEVFGGLWSFIKNVFVGDFSAAWENIKTVVVSAGSAIVNAIRATWEALPIPEPIKAKVESILQSIGNGAVAVFSWIKDKAVEAWGGIRDSVQERAPGIIAAWDSVKEAAGRLWDAVRDAFTRIASKFFGVETGSVSMEEVVGEAMDAAIIVVIALLNAFTDLVNFVVDHKEAFAAALIVIGSAMAAMKIASFVTKLGSMVAGFGSLGSVLSPGGLVILGIGAAAALFFAIKNRIDEAREAEEEFRKRLLEHWQDIADGAKTLQGVFDNLAIDIQSALDKPTADMILGELELLRSEVLNVPADEMEQAWSDGVQRIFDAFSDKYPEIAELLDAYKPAFLEHGKEMAEEVSRGIEQGKESFAEAVQSFIDRGMQVLNLVESQFDQKGQTIGLSLAQGLSLGIQQSASQAFRAAREMADGVIDTAEVTFGVKSPSVVMRSIGNALTAGLAAGIEDGAAQPIEAMGELANQLSTLETALAETEKGSYAYAKALKDLAGFHDDLVEAAEWLEAQNIAVDDSLTALIAATSQYADKQEEVKKAVEDSTRSMGDLREEYEELTTVMTASPLGSLEYADALKGLQSQYDDLMSIVDYLEEAEIAVSESIWAQIRALEEQGVVTRDTARETERLRKEQEELEEAERRAQEAADEATRALEEQQRAAKSLARELWDLAVKSIQKVIDGYKKMKQESEDYWQSIEDIWERYGEDELSAEERKSKNIEDENLRHKRKLEDIALDYQRAMADFRAREFDEAEDYVEALQKVELDHNEDLEDERTRHLRELEDIDTGYTRTLEDNVADREQALADEEEAYKESRTTIGDVIQGIWSDITTYLGDKALDLIFEGLVNSFLGIGTASATAASGVDVAMSNLAASVSSYAPGIISTLGRIAMAFVPLWIGTSDTVARWVADANKFITEQILGQTYGEGTWRLDENGNPITSAHGNLFMSPALTSIAEVGPEAVLPLTDQGVMASVGAAIARSLPQSVGGETTNNFYLDHVRLDSPARVNELAEQLYSLQKTRWRGGEGVRL